MTDDEEMQYKVNIIDSLSKEYLLRNGIRIKYGQDVKIDGATYHDTTTLKGLFDTGLIVVTPTIQAWINEDGNPKTAEYRHKWVQFLIMRHVSGDWGIMCDEDFLSNEQALEEGERIMSVYHYPPIGTPQQTIWIITEWNRTVTTVLDPMDY